MSADLGVDLMRVAWLTLAFMMLWSRVAFQAAGAVRMRAFLDTWQAGPVKRVWGAVCLAFAVVLAVGAVAVVDELPAFEVVLLAALLLVLVGDGLVNVLPAGFETFKSRVQEAWVRRYAVTDRAGDRHLFGAINALLAAASVAVAAVVIAYEPIDREAVLLAAALAAVLTAVLIGKTLAATERGPRRSLRRGVARRSGGSSRRGVRR